MKRTGSKRLNGSITMCRERVYPSLSQARDGWVNPVVAHRVFPTEKTDPTSEELDDAHPHCQMSHSQPPSLILQFINPVYKEYYRNEHVFFMHLCCKSNSLQNGEWAFSLSLCYYGRYCLYNITLLCCCSVSALKCSSISQTHADTMMLKQAIFVSDSICVCKAKWCTSL